MNLKTMNWKTSLAGIGMILTAVGVALKAHFDGDPETIMNIEITLTGLLAGLGLVFARDFDKSSRATGVKG